MTNEEKEKIINVFNTLLDNPLLFKGGLCTWVHNLYITHHIDKDKFILIEKYLNNNLPKKIFSGRVFIYTPLYCWECDVILYRINWINEQIKILQNEKD